MQTISAEQLMEAYARLYPEEQVTDRMIPLFETWLWKLVVNPLSALSPKEDAWDGRCARCFFDVMKIPPPKTKMEMLKIMQWRRL